ncbi:PBSX family phage terminase large subunit [Swingsia samuiensis]|uniref:PBSX family phage terminase large subunit n=1 Tax=Swingsia samuiensis TaxID=1293412 RepID=A0A4Y6UL98_9PROT|nr:PBSX family phage terminase large subunit [Swingsia samuiensis]QDH17418.1 PBSX family phage terminase large subunit [Swingsia samuiensis]
MTNQILIDIPPVFGDFEQYYRYRIWYGGRGSSKSWTVARVLVALAVSKPIRVLCCREFQNSIADSSKKLLADQIDELGLSRWFDITDTSIRSSVGSEFLFKGLARNAQGIKSTEGIDICWVEEAQTTSAHSLELLVPTIRKAGSEIWFTYNPENDDDPVHKLMLSLQDDAKALVRKVNWQDNPWFPAELNDERLRLLKSDPEKYDHIWEGECRTISEAVIFKNRVVVEEFETPYDARFYFGADWGFSQDPTALVRCFISDDILYIDYEAFGHGVEMDELPELFDRIQGSRDWPILADSSRPETISYMANRFRFRISAVDKWPGSVEDGVERLKAFTKIVVHPRCVNLAKEFRMYSYVVDKRSGDILPKIEDKWNHGIDALRYALNPIIRNKRRRPDFSRYSPNRVLR